MLLDALIRWSLDNRLAVLALTAAFLVGGSYVAVRTPVDVLPDLTAPTVTVLVEGQGMAPTEMEALVTYPVEAALNGATGVRRVRSSTAVGIAVVWVDFDWGADVLRARQTVSERLAAVAKSLPDGVAPPLMAPLSSIMGEILFVALQGAGRGGRADRTVAQAGRGLAQRAAGGHPRHPPAAGRQHARADPGAGRRVERDSGRAAGRHAARRATLPPGRLHRAGAGHPERSAAGRHAAGRPRDAAVSGEPAGRRHHPAGDPPVAARMRER